MHRTPFSLRGNSSDALRRAATAYHVSVPWSSQCPRRSFSAQEPANAFSFSNSADAPPSRFHERSTAASDEEGQEGILEVTADNDQSYPPVDPGPFADLESLDHDSYPDSALDTIGADENFEDRMEHEQSLEKIKRMAEELHAINTYPLRILQTLELSQAAASRQDRAIEDQRKEIETRKEETRIAEQRSEELNSVVSDYKKRLAEMDQKIHDANSEKNDLAEKVHRFESDLCEQRANYVESERVLRSEIGNLENNLNCTSSRLHKSKEELAYVERRLEDELVSRTELASRLEERTRDVASLEKSIHTELDRTTTRDKELREEIMQRRNDLASASAKIDDMRIKLEEHAKENNRMKGDFEFVHISTRDLASCVKDFAEALRILGLSASATDVQGHGLDVILSKLQNGSEEFRKEAPDDAKDLSVPLSNTLLTLSSDIRNLRLVLGKSVIREKVLRKNFESCKSSFAHLIAIAKEASRTRSLVKTDVAEATQLLNTAVEKLADVAANKPQFEGRIAKYVQLSSDTSHRLVRQISALKERVLESNEKTAENQRGFQEAFGGQQKLLQACEIRLANAAGEAETTSAELERCRKQLVVSQEEVLSLSKQLKERSDTLKSAKEKSREELRGKELALKEVETLKEKLTQADNNLDSTTTLALDAQVSTQKKIADLEEQLRDVSAERNEAVAQRQRLENSIRYVEGRRTPRPDTAQPGRQGGSYPTTRARDGGLDTETDNKATSTSLVQVDLKGASQYSKLGLNNSNLKNNDQSISNQQVQKHKKHSQPLDSRKAPRRERHKSRTLRSGKRVRRLRGDSNCSEVENCGASDDGEDWMVSMEWV